MKPCFKSWGGAFLTHSISVSIWILYLVRKSSVPRCLFHFPGHVTAAMLLDLLMDWCCWPFQVNYAFKIFIKVIVEKVLTDGSRMAYSV